MVVDDELIAKYLAGEADPEEAEALFDWMADPQNAAHFDKIRSTWDNTFPSRTLKSVNLAEAWNNVNPQVSNPAASKPAVVSLSRSSVLWYGVAATLIVGFGLWKFYTGPAPVHNETTILSAADTRSVMLPDSSGVVLSKNSSISYRESFGEKGREVDFKGEAFFKVKGNAAKPFVIHAGLANIRVIGTVFNVYQDDDSVQVSVEEGKVYVYTQNDSILLEPGHMATIRSKAKEIILQNKVDINAWGYATRRFVFKDTPLQQVFAIIEKAYPYSIEIRNDDIKNCKFTASFDHVSAPEILNLIGETLDLTIQQNESTFRVEGKGCPWVH